MANAVVINGSPNVQRGNTAMLVAPFTEGMKEGGAEIQVFYAGRLKIKPCTGEMHCWYQKPGECLIQDDMQSVYPALKEAEILVLATPVYIPLPGAMQDVINRLLPLVEPYLETREGRTRARFRPDVRIRQMVLVASGGWWERENLATVERIVQELADNASVEYAGAVLRPHAFLMKEDGQLTGEGQAVLSAARRTGYQLVADGRMSEETLREVSRPLIEQEELRQRYNRWLR